MILCVLFPDGVEPSDAVLEVVLEAAPRTVLEWPRVWLDVRGLDPPAVFRGVQRRLRKLQVAARYGAGTRPVVAWVAAQSAAEARVEVVAPGDERAFLAPRPLAELGLEDPLLGWLADVGIAQCGELADVAQEAVEVRFGAEAVRWWQLARGDDRRRLFAPVPPPEPSASVDFVDYVVTDPERLVFTTNALLGGICEQIRARGAHARRLRLRLPLANGTVWERTLKSARPTADRAAWLRLARTVLERLTVPDAVAGVAIDVESSEAAAAVQGDLFDAGFATAGAAETALARLLEEQGDVVREPVAGAHPLVEHRGDFQPLSFRDALQPPETETLPAEPIGLTLQLLPEPRPVSVEAVPRRDHIAPVRYRDGRWHALVEAAGPDRVSGGQWDAAYAREYFRALTADGTLVWLFRDAGRDRWYLHGWWD